MSPATGDATQVHPIEAGHATVAVHRDEALRAEQRARRPAFTLLGPGSLGILALHDSLEDREHTPEFHSMRSLGAH